MFNVKAVIQEIEGEKIPDSKGAPVLKMLNVLRPSPKLAQLAQLARPLPLKIGISANWIR